MKSKKIKVGDIYEDCAYHPVKCTYSKGDNIEGISLVDGSAPRCCSVSNCRPKKITMKSAEELIELWKKGEKAVMIFKGWTESNADKFIKLWRQTSVKKI